MKLLALNRQWAVYGTEGSRGKLDSFAALHELLRVHSYQQLINYLITQTCNDVFLTAAETSFSDAFYQKDRIWHKSAADINLRGSLSNAIDRYPNIDYLDELAVSDLKKSDCYQLDLTVLMNFKEIIRKLLIIAAVALGADIQKGLFVEIPSEDIFDAEWIKGNVRCEPDELHTIGLNQNDLGFNVNEVLDEGLYDTVFSCTRGYSRHQLIMDDSKEYGKYTDGYPFSIDTVIYSYAEYGLPSEQNHYQRDYYFTVSFLDGIDPGYAKMLLAGRMVEAVLNAWPYYAGQKGLEAPYHPDVDCDIVKFVPGEGFIENKATEPSWWVDELCNEAFELIIQGKVSICPVCGNPVLIKDYRGRKHRLVCSDSCKTRACNQRRESAYHFAMSGKPIDEAISAIGDEYSDSVCKWYAEVHALNV